MPSTITTGSAPKLLWPGLQAIWGTSYKEHEQFWREMFTVETSDKSYEEVQQVVAFGLAPEKPETTDTVYDSWNQGFTARYDNIPYALGFKISREAIADNKYPESARQRTAQLAFSARTTKETVHANIYNRGFDGAFPGSDGQPLLSTVHPTVSGNQSNRLTVDADLSEQALEDISIQIRNALNDRNLPIMLSPVKLFINPAERFNATRILESQLRSGTTDNDVNALYNNTTIPEGWMDNMFLTDPDAWFVKTTALQGMTSFERDMIEFSQDSEFDAEVMKYKFYERYSAFWSDWRGIYGSPGV